MPPVPRGGEELLEDRTWRESLEGGASAAGIAQVLAVAGILGDRAGERAALARRLAGQGVTTEQVLALALHVRQAKDVRAPVAFLLRTLEREDVPLAARQAEHRLGARVRVGRELAAREAWLARAAAARAKGDPIDAEAARILDLREQVARGVRYFEHGR